MAFESSGPRIPNQLGKHRIVGKLATGGMASVYLARLVGPAGFENVVVIKRMLPHLAEDARFREMFADEARTVAKIRHPNVVRIFELISDHDEFYLVMEYLEGDTLQRLNHGLISRRRGLSFGLACFIIAEAALGLHAAHELMGEDGKTLGVVHRDVSPHNLFVTYDGSVKVIDFGIAKSVDQANVTSTGELKGKFAYMAPEQVAGRQATRRTDVFALGVTLWELLTRTRLFQRENQMVTLRAVAEEITPPPSSVVPEVPPELDEICARCLAKNPDDRYTNMLELRRDLLAAMRLLETPDPASELAGLVQELFEKSTAHRQAMLRESRANAEPFVEPSATEEAPTEVSSSQVKPAESSQNTAAPAGSGRGLLVALFVAVIALSGMVIFVLMEPPTETPPLAAVVSAPIPEPDVVVAAPPPEPVIAEVTVSIDSNPTGALVTIDGIARGNAPITLEMPTSDQPSELVLSLDGYRNTTARFVPDREVDLRLDLTRASRGSRPRGRGATEDGSGTSGTETPRGEFTAFD